MTDTVITCPRCGSDIPLTEALTSQLHAKFDAEHHARLQQAVAEADARARAEADARMQALVADDKSRSRTPLPKASTKKWN